MSPTIVLRAARRRATAIVAVLALTVLAGISTQPQAAHAAVPTNMSVTQAGGFSIGPNTGAVTIKFTTTSAFPSGSLLTTTMTGATKVGSDCNDTSTCAGFAYTIGGSTRPGALFRFQSSPASQYSLATIWVAIWTSSAIAANTEVIYTLAPGAINWDGTSTAATFDLWDYGVNTRIDQGSLSYSPSAPTQTVTFHNNLGSGSIAPQTASSATLLTANAGQMSRAGYTFNGWNTLANGTGTQYGDNASYPFSASTDLYAQWTINSYVVTYDTHGGSAVGNGSFTTGGTVTLPIAAPTRSGYSFNGWFAAQSGGNPLASPYTPGVMSAITLHAQWTLSAATVSFDANGGIGTTAAQTASSTALLNSNGFTRAGYGFSGWNSAANGTGTSYSNGSSYPFSASVTLYAQWRLLPTKPTVSVDILVPVGGTVANAPVALDVDGLKDQTGYTVTVHSTPQVIDQGMIWSGRLNKAVTLPAGLESGWHRLVIDGTAADGSAFSETFYFKVSPTGTLLTTSATVPAELASTGANVAPISIAGGLLGLGALAFVLSAYRRRVSAE